MMAFRVLLIAMIAGTLIYTGIVGINEGWNLLPVFFGDIFSLSWRGQFNLDFTCFLTLSGLWLAWRHSFSLGGMALGIIGLFGGIIVLAPYLVIVSFTAKGNMKEILLGKARLNS